MNWKYSIEIDLRALAAFRIALAATIIFSLAVVLPDYRAFLSYDGIVPSAPLRQILSVRSISLYLLIDHHLWSKLLLLTNFIAALTLMIGYRTKLSIFVCWVLYLSFCNRAYIIGQGGDALILLLLFWSIFLPVGRIFSVDGAVDRSPPQWERPVASVSSAAMTLQVLYVYFFGALMKTGAEWFPNGSAIYSAIHLDTFATPAGILLRPFSDLTYFGTFAVHGLELIAPIILLLPFRAYRTKIVIVLMLILMHISFRLFLNIGHFWLVSISSLLLLLRKPFWDWIEFHYWKARGREVVIYYEDDCAFCRKVAMLIKAFFLPRSAQVAPAQSNQAVAKLMRAQNSWVVQNPAGQHHTKWDALIYATSLSPIARPVHWLCRLVAALKLGEMSYDLIGRNRRLLGAVLTFILPRQRSAPNALKHLANALVAILLLTVLTWNILATTPHKPRKVFWQPVVDMIDLVALDQTWNMFAPRPHLQDYWPYVDAIWSDGSQIQDVENANRNSQNWEQMYRSHRWRKYFGNVIRHSERQRNVYLKYYASYRCQSFTSARVGAPENLQLTVQTRITRSNFEQEEGIFLEKTLSCE